MKKQSALPKLPFNRSIDYPVRRTVPATSEQIQATVKEVRQPSIAGLMFGFTAASLKAQ